MKKNNEQNHWTNELIKNKRIAIIGGGAGGLSLARLLQMRGGNVKVYERDESRNARISGSSLDLHDDTGQRVIEEAALMEAFKIVSRPGDGVRIYDKHKKLLLDASPDTFTANKPEIDRPKLRDLLLDSLEPNTVQWNKYFQSLNVIEGNKYEIQFKDGETIVADIVVGSDGANSKIRPYITDIKPRYSGTTLIQGEIENPEMKCPEIYKMLNKGNMFVLGDSKSILMQQKGDGTLVFYVTSKQTEEWIKDCGVDFNDNQKVCLFLEQFYEGWDKVFFTLFKASTNFVPRPMYGTPIEQTWTSKSTLTIIGDAAHVMPPFAGVGVNMAMFDALELANCLTDKTIKDLDSAIQSYERAMLERTSIAQAQTKNSEDIFHSPTAIEDLLNKINEK